MSTPKRRFNLLSLTFIVLITIIIIIIMMIVRIARLVIIVIIIVHLLVMPILVRGYDVRSGTKANTRHRRIWATQASSL